jgi:hypothetical protein
MYLSTNPTQPNPGTCNGRGPRLPRRAPSAVSLGPFVFPFAWAICIRVGARRLGRLGEWPSGFARVCVFQRAPSFPLRHVPARPSLDSRRHLTTLSRDPHSTFSPSAAALLHCALRSWLSNRKDSRSIYLPCPVLPRVVVAQVGSSVRANCCERLQLPANHARLRRDVKTWARSTSCLW